MSVTCLVCNKVVAKCIGRHISNAHNMTLSQYYDRYYKKDDTEGLCKVCGKTTKFYKLNYGYRQYCSRECQTKGSIEKYGSYNNRQSAIKTCKELFNGKMNSGAWPTRTSKIEQFEQEHNCTSTKKLFEIYGQGWKALHLPKIMINKQNSAISNEYLPLIAEYSNTYHNSIVQQELVEFIKSFYSKTIIQNDRQVIKPKELDIVLPDLNIAIEFNGIRWHSIELGTPIDYHLNKSIICKNAGYRLIHIYEFEDFEIQKQLLKALILGNDNYPKNDYNKNNYLDIPKPTVIYKDDKYTLYGAGKLISERM